MGGGGEEGRKGGNKGKKERKRERKKEREREKERKTEREKERERREEEKIRLHSCFLYSGYWVLFSCLGLYISHLGVRKGMGRRPRP